MPPAKGLAQCATPATPTAPRTNEEDHNVNGSPPLLLTVGHGARTQPDFENLLLGAQVTSLVDVRIGPGSRKHPHFGRLRMEEWLPEAGIKYR